MLDPIAPQWRYMILISMLPEAKFRCGIERVLRARDEITGECSAISRVEAVAVAMDPNGIYSNLLRPDDTGVD